MPRYFVFVAPDSVDKPFDATKLEERIRQAAWPIAISKFAEYDPIAVPRVPALKSTGLVLGVESEPEAQGEYAVATVSGRTLILKRNPKADLIVAEVSGVVGAKEAAEALDRLGAHNNRLAEEIGSAMERLDTLQRENAKLKAPLTREELDSLGVGVVGSADFKKRFKAFIAHRMEAENK